MKRKYIKCRLCKHKAIGTYQDNYGNRYYLCYECGKELGYTLLTD